MKSLIFYIKNFVLRHKSLKLYKQLKIFNSMTYTEREKTKIQKMQKIFTFAKNNSIFYKNKYRDLDIDKFHNDNEWHNIPILTKNEIRKYASSIITTKQKYLMKITTGGSTGEPLTVYHDKRFTDEIIGWEMLESWGISPSCDKAFIYRTVRTSRLKRIFNAIMWYPTRRLFLDAKNLTQESMQRFTSELFKLKPQLLQGYVGGLLEYAKYCEDKKISFDFLKAAWATSAPLSESNRKFLESIFNTKVYDQYGCCEIFWLAAECKLQKGLHVHDAFRLIEIVDENGKIQKNGEYGDVVVTDLSNFAFPLIRYRNGDRGRYLVHGCECGSKSPLVDKIKGRISDNIRLPNGKVISGEYFTTIFDDKPEAVKSFQIHQHVDYSIDLRCVKTDIEKADQICTEKKSQIEEITNHKIKVNLVYVDKIPHDSGKTRFIISDIK